MMLWFGIAVGALSCYLLKLAGLSVPKRLIEDRRVQAAAALLPVGMLAALTATQTFAAGGHLTVDARAVGLACALIAVALRAPFLVIVAVAALATALTRLLL
jgi:fluoride ion exporter CrcB/FEX